MCGGTAPAAPAARRLARRLFGCGDVGQITLQRLGVRAAILAGRPFHVPCSRRRHELLFYILPVREFTGNAGVCIECRLLLQLQHTMHLNL